MNNQNINIQDENSVENVIKVFTKSEYYKQKVEFYETRISNIEEERPEYEGLKGQPKTAVLTGREKKQRLKHLNSMLEEIKKDKNKYDNFAWELETLYERLGQFIKEKILLDSLHLCFTDILNIYDEYELTNDILSKNIKTIQKTAERLFNDNGKLRVMKGFDRVFDIIEKYKPYGGVFKKATTEIRTKHSPASLGVDEKEIRRAKGIVYNNQFSEKTITEDAMDAYDKLKYLESVIKYEPKIDDYFKIVELKDSYQSVLSQSFKLWYIEKVLEAYKNTDIKDSKTYQALLEKANKMHMNIAKEINNIDKSYEKLGLQRTQDLAIKLEDLYMKTEQLKISIEQARQRGDNFVADALEQDYHRLKGEMRDIIEENPQFNKPKYEIDVKNNTMVTAGNQSSTKEEQTIEEVVISKDDFQLESNIQIARSAQYQNYMMEKMRNRGSIIMSFSEYLLKNAPHLKELIQIEQKREKSAQTIYKEYLKYYAALEDKSYAMSFESFAEKRYGIDNIDVPVQEQESYEGMRKR